MTSSTQFAPSHSPLLTDRPFRSLLVCGASGGVAADFADSLGELADETRFLTETDPQMDVVSRIRSDQQPVALVLFVETLSRAQVTTILESLRTLAQESKIARVVCVTDLTPLFDDSEATDRETSLRALIAPIAARFTILRTGWILSPQSSTTQFCQNWAWASPLLGTGPRSCFVDPDLLRQTIVAELTEHSPSRRRTITLLGPNRTWKQVLAEHRGPSLRTKLLSVISEFVKLLLVGFLVRGVLHRLCRSRPAWRALDFETLAPRSTAALISLWNRHNVSYIQPAGYNNGVTHFGWQFPGKTVVRTIESGTMLRTRGSRLSLDAGITLRRAIDELATVGKEFHVVPNFSYIAMGTVFFVPVHGSGSDVATLGTTIERVLLYDPHRELFLRAKRGEPAFAEAMYNTRAGRLLLRLTFRVKDKSNYFVQKTILDDPTAETIWRQFDDPETSNIELRKRRAKDRTVDVFKYYNHSASPDGTDDRLEVPRDAIGRIWDRLEENRFTAFLFHLLVRRFGYHVELFMTQPEFVAFWNHHTELPISKIQLRYVQRDGMQHSPFRDADVVSADLFMSRKHREAFRTFIRTHLPRVRTNPGKQSM